MMKNKAQEGLKVIRQCSIVQNNYCHNEKRNCSVFASRKTECHFYKDGFKSVEHLIDNQLTVEELRTMATALNHLEVDYSSDILLRSENKSLKRIPMIRDKLKKQKEMWEVE